MRLNRRLFPLFFPIKTLRFAAAWRTRGIVMIGLCFLSVIFAKGTARQAPAPPGPNIKAVETLIQQGVEAYRHKDLLTAIHRLRQAYPLSPNNREVGLLLGLMLYEEKSSSLEAQKLMESVSAFFPSDKDLQMKLLDSYLQTQHLSSVPALLDRIRPFMLKEISYGYQILYILIRYGQTALAQKEINLLASQIENRWNQLAPGQKEWVEHKKLKSEYAELIFIRGLLAATRLEKKSALENFQAADRLDFPLTDSFQMGMLAESLVRLGENSLAIKAYVAYLKNFPADTKARFNLAQLFYYDALYPQAQEHFQKVLEQAPQTAKVHLYLGITFLEMKNQEEARRHFEEELEMDPQSYQSMAELAYLDYVIGENESCRQWLEKAQKVEPDWYETNMVYGMLYNRLGQFERAIESLEKTIKATPRYYKAHFQLSLACRRIGNEAKAKEYTQIYEKLVAEEKDRQLQDMAQ